MNNNKNLGTVWAEKEIEKRKEEKESLTDKTCLLKGCDKKCPKNKCFCSAEHHNEYHRRKEND